PWLTSWASKRLPGWFVQAAPLLRTRKLLAPVRAALPVLSRARPSRKVVPLSAMPPWATVRPAPVMVPPVQLSRPLTVTESLPCRVPPDSVKEVTLIGCPVLRSSVAPSSSRVGTVYDDPAAKVTVPLPKLTLPAPLTEAPLPIVYEAPSKPRAVPEATLT